MKKQEDMDGLAKEGALNILGLIREHIGKHGVKNSPILFAKELQDRIREEVAISLNDFIEAAEVGDDSQLTLEFAENIFDVMEALTQGDNVEDKQLQEILVTGQSNANKELIQTFIESHKEKNTFIQKLTNKIKDGVLSNKNELAVVKEYRQTSEARKDVKRPISKQTISIDNDVIQKFLEDMSSATKAEVLVRLEKYIESGWFEVDQPLKEYYNPTSLIKDKVSFAASSLKTAMEIRFDIAKFERIVERENNFQFDKFAIDVVPKNKDKHRSVLSLAKAGEKDFCIRSADGKRILMGDVTAEETGEWNKNSWLNGLRAAKDYEKSTGEKIDYSVSIVSLFYDEDDKTKDKDKEIKAKFLNKLNSHNQEFIDQFHFLQFVSVLSRDTMNFEYKTTDLLNNVNVNFIGSKSDAYCNSILALKGEDFVEKTFDIVESVSRKLINDRAEENGKLSIYDGGVGAMTAEGIPLRVLLNAISSLSVLTLEYPKFENRFKDLITEVEGLQEIITANSELYNLALDTGRKVLTLDYDKKQMSALLKKHNEFKEFREEKERQEREILMKNDELLEKNQNSIMSLLRDVKLFVSFFPNMNDELNKIRKNKSSLIDREVAIEIFMVLRNFMENPESQNGLITIPPSFKKEALNDIASPRSVMFKFANALNASYGKNAIGVYKSLDFTIDEMKKLVNGTEEYVNSQCGKIAIQMARKNIEGMNDKSTQEIKEHLSVRVNEVNEFLSGLLVNIHSQQEQIAQVIKKSSVKKNTI